MKLQLMVDGNWPAPPIDISLSLTQQAE